MESNPAESVSRPGDRSGSAEITPLAEIQAQVALVQRKIASDDLPRAMEFFRVATRAGRQIDLAEAIGEIAKLTQGDVQEIREAAKAGFVAQCANQSARSAPDESILPPILPADSSARQRADRVSLAIVGFTVVALLVMLWIPRGEDSEARSGQGAGPSPRTSREDGLDESGREVPDGGGDPSSPEKGSSEGDGSESGSAPGVGPEPDANHAAANADDPEESSSSGVESGPEVDPDVDRVVEEQTPEWEARREGVLREQDPDEILRQAEERALAEGPAAYGESQDESRMTPEEVQWRRLRQKIEESILETRRVPPD